MEKSCAMHHGIIDRRVAMGVVLAHDVADRARRFAVGPVPLIAGLAHRIEDAPVHGLQAVAHIGQRPGHDHAHGVIEVGTLHLLFDGDGRDVGGRRARGISQSNSPVDSEGYGGPRESVEGP
jgi:hypothetical protein